LLPAGLGVARISVLNTTLAAFFGRSRYRRSLSVSRCTPQRPAAGSHQPGHLAQATESLC